MPLKMYRPGEDMAPPGICIFGPGGVGKTSLLGTLVGHGLVLDTKNTEGGTHVLKDHAARIIVAGIQQWDDLDEAFVALLAKNSRALPGVNFATLKWVAIDSVTGTQTLAKRKVIKDRPLKANPHKVTQPEFGQIGELVSEMVYKYRLLPYTTIFTAQERSFGGGADNEEPSKIGPAVLPSALTSLLTSLLLVGRLTVNSNGDRVMRVQPHPMYIAKSRSLPGKSLPSMLLRPNLTTVLRYMLADGKKPRGVDVDSLLLE